MVCIWYSFEPILYKVGSARLGLYPIANENNIELDSCYVEASIDVTNNKWLLHTASALIDWIEQPDPNRDGTYINAYYRPLLYSDNDDDCDQKQDCRIERDRIFALEGPVSYGGGKFPVYS